jgi:hypothetical protein
VRAEREIGHGCDRGTGTPRSFSAIPSRTIDISNSATPNEDSLAVSAGVSKATPSNLEYTPELLQGSLIEIILDEMSGYDLVGRISTTNRSSENNKATRNESDHEKTELQPRG